MKWDPTGERLVTTFQDSNLIAVFCTQINPAAGVSISPLGYITGNYQTIP